MVAKFRAYISASTVLKGHIKTSSTSPCSLFNCLSQQLSVNSLVADFDRRNCGWSV